MGKVIATLYAPESAPPEFPIAIVVDFQDTKGQHGSRNILHVYQ